MIGIYKITNKINNHCYIGQSRQIEQRWKNHIVASNNQNDQRYEYPLYRAFRKYGISNFDFSVLEECSINDLDNKEIYWISCLNPEYNQTVGENYKIVPKKLSIEQVKEIQNILSSSKDISHMELAYKYNVSKDTIRDINVGRTWFDENLTYPLHKSKYATPKEKFFCIDCGKEIVRGSIRCIKCNAKTKITEKPVTREELKILIRTKPFTEIGNMFNVSDNTIRKWCDKYNLPRKKAEIQKYSDIEWEKL